MSAIKYNEFMADKKGGEKMSPRTGRPPSDDPKVNRITVRLTEQQQKELQQCSDKFGVSKADVVSRGLKLMTIALKNPEARQLFDAIQILEELSDKNDVKQQIEQIKANFRWYLETKK